jgi:hypothetical protein
MDFNSQGTLYAKSQVTDYMLRDDQLNTYNVLEFFTNTYEKRISNAERESFSERTTTTSPRRGRHPNPRAFYLPEHPKSNGLVRIIRTANHNNLPNMIGPRFPHCDDENTHERYCALMLMLLKPWRDLETDLKGHHTTWKDAFDAFMLIAPKERRDVASGIHYLNETHSAIDKDHNTVDLNNLENELVTNENVEEHGKECDLPSTLTYNEESLKAIIHAQTSWPEEMHGRLAVEIGKLSGIFENFGEDTWNIDDSASKIKAASSEDLHNLQSWREQIQHDIDSMNSCTKETQPSDSGNVQHLTEQINIDPSVQPVIASEMHMPFGDPVSAIEPELLNIEQHRAYDIIIWHLEQTLAGRNPPPLRLIIHGEGGTGKSKVLQTVSHTFKERGCEHLLLKSAYTGVASSLIEGKTTHIIAGIGVTSGRHDYEKSMREETRKKLQEFWKTYQYLAIDEMSMIAKDFLALLSRNISIAKQGESNISFGGINIILLGDFHQFPPVARSIKDALYYPSDPERNTSASQLGRAIFEEFTMVVELTEQKRVVDPVWLDFLHHLRKGEIEEEDLKLLHSLTIEERVKHNEDFSKPPWRNAILVTPRHAVRTQWNDLCLRQMCKDTHRPILVCKAKDTITGRPLTIKEQCILESHRNKRGKGRQRDLKDLPHEIELAIGMKVMVTNNLETDLDITNGARGKIIDILLHPDEPPLNTHNSRIELKFLPICILVKLAKTRAKQLKGLDECVIPIEPTTSKYHINMTTPDGKKTQRTFERHQFPVTAAYAFTDYRSQGQSILYLFVDIASPPTGSLSLFNLYVALSRSSGRETIRLLRDFDDKIFLKRHDEALNNEDKLLHELNKETDEWYVQVVKG